MYIKTLLLKTTEQIETSFTAKSGFIEKEKRAFFYGTIIP
jgi:hypothetical protein